MHFVTFPLSGRSLNLHKIVMSFDDREKRVVRVVQEGGHCETFVGDEYDQARIFFHMAGADAVENGVTGNMDIVCIVFDASSEVA